MSGYKQVLQNLRRQLWEYSMQEERSHCYQALQKVQAVAAMLKERYGVKQVYLYGSWPGADSTGVRESIWSGGVFRQLLEGPP